MNCWALTWSQIHQIKHQLFRHFQVVFCRIRFDELKKVKVGVSGVGLLKVGLFFFRPSFGLFEKHLSDFILELTSTLENFSSSSLTPRQNKLEVCALNLLARPGAQLWENIRQTANSLAYFCYDVNNKEKSFLTLAQTVNVVKLFSSLISPK